MKHAIISPKPARRADADYRHGAGSSTKSDQAVGSKQQFQPENLPKAQSAVLLGLAQFNKLPDSAYVREPVVRGIFSISKSTLRRWVDASIVPPPKIVGRIRMWNVGQLRETLRKIEDSGQVSITTKTD